MSLADNTTSDATINALKRRINTLQEIVCREKEIDTQTMVPVWAYFLKTINRHNGNIIVSSVVNSRYEKYVLSGRAIRRLVTLSDRVEDLVNEADRRACIELDSDDDDYSGFTEELRLFKVMLRIITYWYF